MPLLDWGKFPSPPVERPKLHYSMFYCPKRSWDKVIFSEACVKNSIHMGSLQGHTQGEVEGSGLGVFRSTPMEKVGGLAGGVSRPRPKRLCIPPCTEADPPTSRRLLLRSVRILLECILFVIHFLCKICIFPFCGKLSIKPSIFLSAFASNDILQEGQSLLTAYRRKQSCGKVIFSKVSVCQSFCPHVTITGSWDLPPPGNLFKVVHLMTPRPHTGTDV